MTPSEAIATIRWAILAFIALFLAGVPLANVIGAPLSGWMLGFGGALKGWQWMLLLEGVPSLVFGLMTLWVLPPG